MKENLTIGFIENPNCGKTTLFNAYTGANLKVANWPGVTVEKVEGAIRDHDLNIRLVDLPGTYSLTSYTMEEQVSRQFILSDEVVLWKSGAWRLTRTGSRKCLASRSFRCPPERGRGWMCCSMRRHTIRTVKIRIA